MHKSETRSCNRESLVKEKHPGQFTFLLYNKVTNYRACTPIIDVFQLGKFVYFKAFIVQHQNKIYIKIADIINSHIVQYLHIDQWSHIEGIIQTKKYRNKDIYSMTMSLRNTKQHNDRLLTRFISVFFLLVEVVCGEKEFYFHLKNSEKLCGQREVITENKSIIKEGIQPD